MRDVQGPTGGEPGGGGPLPGRQPRHGGARVPDQGGRPGHLLTDQGLLTVLGHRGRPETE